jgi:hypothetical protein
VYDPPVGAVLGFGFAASIFCTPVTATASEESEPASDGEAELPTPLPPELHPKAAAALAARSRCADLQRQRRLARRDGAEPTPRAERHKSKAQQLEEDTSAESLLRAVEYNCRCSLPNCVKPTSVFVQECRTHKLHMRKHGKELLAMLRSAVVEVDDGLQLDFVNGQVHFATGVHACPRQFRNLFSIKPNMWRRLKMTVQEKVLPSSMWGVPASVHSPGMCGPLAAAWFRRWAVLVGCYPPNAATNIQLHVDAKTKIDIWRMFLHEQGAYAVSYQHFCRVTIEEAARPPKISMRHKKDVSSPCADCIRLKENLSAALDAHNPVLIDAAKAALIAHSARIRSERSFYMTTIAMASEQPPPVISCVWDIMDQHKCLCPNIKGALAQALAGEQRMPLKLLGFTWHGDHGYSFIAPPWVPKGANLTCSALYLALLDAKARRVTLPPVLKINIDGGAENWNVTTFAFLSHLVTAGVFKSVMPSRLPVGHTHNDQDQVFSRYSTGLHGTKTMDTGRASATPAEWEQTLRNCSATAAGQTEVVWMSSVFDFDSYYAGKLENLGKYGASTQWTRAGTEQARLEETARSHFRYAPLDRLQLHSRRLTRRPCPLQRGADPQGRWRRLRHNPLCAERCCRRAG